MNIDLVMVSSLNGKITNGSEDPFYWASTEDQKHFKSLKETYPVLILGRGTYEAAKERIKLSSLQKRIVMTKNSDEYKKFEVPGQLEFSQESPKELIDRLENEGYEKALLLGGGKLNASFLQEKLIDTLYLTIEPVIFGDGKELFEEAIGSYNLKPIEVKKINIKGTMVLSYAIVYE